MKQQFIEDKAATIRLSIYADNRPIVPTSGTITLLKPDGSELQAETAVTVNADTGEMTYSLTSTHTADKDLNYIAKWAYIVNGVTYFENQLFDVVLSVLSIPITDDDLYAELESLRKANNQATGTATAGAAGSLTDTIRRKEDDDFWKGGVIKIISGTGVGQERNVTGFTQSTGVITVSPNFTTTPDTTSIYKVVRSFSVKIENAFETLETMLYNKGKRHELILESSQIKYPLLYLTIHTISLDLFDDETDKWYLLATKYWDKFTQAFGNMTLEYDEDESGTVSEDEQQGGINEIRIRRA
jgi:hypothetical protein